MTPLLQIMGLRVRYVGTNGEALRGIDLTIGTGERVAVIGESGSGKSTLALALAGLLPRDALITGSISWSRSLPPPLTPPHKGEGELPRPGPPPSCGEGLGVGVKSEWLPANGKDIGFVFQDAGASLNPVLTVGRQVAEVVRVHLGLDRSAAMKRAAALFAQVRLPNPDALLEAYPHRLSGGQRQRVGIAAAIAANPALLIADEPTSALDTIVQAEIVRLIGALVAETGMSLLIVTHDIALAATIADRIVVLKDGAIVEESATAKLVETPQATYTRSLLDACLTLEDVGSPGAARP